MADDGQAAATKQDIQLLMEEMGEMRLTLATKEEMRAYADKKHQETVDEIKAYIGTMERDFEGATKDEMQILKEKDENHEVRITHVEQELAAMQT